MSLAIPDGNTFRLRAVAIWHEAVFGQDEASITEGLEEVRRDAFDNSIAVFALETTARAFMTAVVEQHEFRCLALGAADQLYCVLFVQTASPFAPAITSNVWLRSF
jgi:hypothetical protein